jgi:hypothetical protein
MATPPIKNLARLDRAIRLAMVDITGVNSNGLVSPAGLQAAAQPTIDAFDDSDTAQNAAENQAYRGTAQIRLDDDRTDLYKILRAEADVLVGELNILRQWFMSFKAEVAAATSLADLKSRVATLPDTPDRTLSQALTALKNTISQGNVD